MSHLKDLLPEIDAGRTAKLVIPPMRPGGVSVTIRIKKYNQYFWQRATIDHPLAHPLGQRPNTAGFPSWSELCKGIDTRSDQWEVCDEDLEPTPSILEFLYPPEEEKGKEEREVSQ